MKKILPFFILLQISFCQLPTVFAGSGGPDAYGYTWKDSNDSLGPVFSWYDVFTNNKRVKITGLGDDNVTGPFPIAGNFTFYWYSVDKFWVGSNGYISFGKAINLASQFPSIPNATDSKNNFIAAMLSDLSFVGVGDTGQCWYVDMGDSLIVSWINVPFWKQQNPQWTGSNTFEIILNKLDSSITVNYLTQTGLTQMNDITIGIEDVNGDIGLQHSKNTYPVAGYSIKYYYPQNPGPITDGGAHWNTAEGSKGIFLNYPTNPFTLVTNVANFGNQKVGTFTVDATVTDAFGATVTTSSANTSDSLSGGKDTTLVFPSDFTPLSDGTYSYKTMISGITGDGTGTNDSVTQEIVAIDTSLQTMNLSYTNSTFENGLGWAGGMGGIAMYFAPPFYPVKITATNFLINQNLANKSFYAKIYDDDGLNGAAGTLLDSVFVDAPQIIVGSNTNVPVSSPVIIDSGGFYILWDMNGDSLNLAYDYTKPISHRTYEVLGGIWAEYRNNDTADFFISADIQKLIINDVGALSVTSPVAGAFLSAPTLVTCNIKNYGNVPQTNFPVNYNYNNGAIVTETYSATIIPAGDSASYTFSSPFYDTNSGTGNLCVWTSFSADTFYLNDTSCITVQFVPAGIKESSNDFKVNIYPNPSDGKFMVQITNQYGFTDYGLKIYNILGEIIYRLPITDYRLPITIDLSNHPNGIYFLQLKTENGITAKKITINK